MIDKRTVEIQRKLIGLRAEIQRVINSAERHPNEVEKTYIALDGLESIRDSVNALMDYTRGHNESGIATCRECSDKLVENSRGLMICPNCSEGSKYANSYFWGD